MIAIITREFKSFFSNMIGYVIVAVLCFFLGLFYSITNLDGGYPYFARALDSMHMWVMLMLPILTMKCLSEDRKSKTDQILLTTPVSVTKIVMGKYIGMVLVYLIPIVYACIFPLLQLRMENHDMLIDYSSIFALFMIGCVYISIGMFISSLTESQIIAAVVTFATFFMMYIMSGITTYIPDSTVVNAVGVSLVAVLLALIINSSIRNSAISAVALVIMLAATWIVYFVKGDIYMGLLAKLLNVVSLSNGITYFVNGIFDVKSIVMFISMIVLFIYLTTQSIQKRRWS